MLDRGTITLVVVALFVFVASHLYALNLACHTYHVTPDVPNFQHFVAPSGPVIASKTRYLFGIFAFSLLGIPLILIAPGLRSTPSTRLFGALFLMSLIVVVAVSFEANLAESATRTSGWHGHAAPNPDVDGACKAAAYLPRIFGLSFE
jgi:hypothetical protein